MTAGEIVSVVGVVTVGIGLGITWMRNGRDQARREGEYSQTLKHINDKLEDVCKTTDETKDSIGTMKEHCASSVSTFSEQITTLFRRQQEHNKRLNQLDRRLPD